jgi:PKD repeat protein
VTLQDIAAAFRWRFVPIVPSHTNVNPSDGTLVNVDTIFYADTAGTMRTTITMLGEQVALTLHPTRWQWTFGDGSTMTTTTPGAPYPDTSVTHRYSETGTYPASVTVTWDGTFTFGGQTADIPGDTSRAGPAVGVTVKEAHSHLVNG